MKTFAMTCVLMLMAGACLAQEKPKFEVASIRPFVPKPGSGGMAPPQNPEHLSTSMTLRALILRAYGLETYQLVGPGSLATVWTVAANAVSGTTQAQQNLMLQSLLEERFRLTFHHEMKEFKAFNLVVAKGGLKLKDSLTSDGCAMGASSVGGKSCGPVTGQEFGIAKTAGKFPAEMMTSPKGASVAFGFTMANFAHALRSPAGEIVIDKTGIRGAYDILMSYSTIDSRTGHPSMTTRRCRPSSTLFISSSD